MKRNTYFLKFAMLGIFVCGTYEAHAQAVDVQAIVAAMKTVNGIIKQESDITLARCDKQGERRLALVTEQAKRAPELKRLSTQRDALKVELDNRTKASTAVETALANIDARIATLKLKIANIAKVSDQEAAFGKQITDNTTARNKSEKELANVERDFANWKESNDTVLLRALLATLQKSPLSKAEQDAIGVLDAYDKAVTNLTKSMSDNDAAIAQATTALAALQAGENKTKAELTNTLNDLVASRPTAVSSVAAAQGKVKETQGALRGVDAQIAVRSSISIPDINPICRKLKS